MPRDSRDYKYSRVNDGNGKTSSNSNSGGGSAFTKIITIIFLLFLFSVIIMKVVPTEKNKNFFPFMTKEKEQFAREQAALQSMIYEFNISKNELLNEKINKEYGSYSNNLLSPEILKEYFDLSPQFEERLIRRYQMKILSSYFFNDKDDDETFVWTTAGHSAAAGHGNLFNQTFTSIIEQTVKDVFDSTGIKFEARNYAMGGFGSFPELALCMESIYGSDVDMLSWDFGMTDAGPVQALSGIDLWGNRAGLLPSFPLIFGFGSERGRINKFMSFNGTVALNYKKMNKIRREVIPDATTFLDPESLPLPLRNYNCKDHFESGDPCSDTKFDTKRFCEKVDGQVSWHPGWKEHLFLGRLIGLYLTEYLERALYELKESSIRNVGDDAETTITIPHFSLSYLQHLREEELKDRSNFLSTTPDTKLFQSYVPNEKLANDLFRNHILCHSSLLPSAIRYNGIIQPPANDNNGNSLLNYDIGINQKTYYDSSSKNLNESLTLVYDEEERHGEKCDLPTRIDFKDRFFIGLEQSNGVKFTLPTDNELKAYKHAIPTQPTKAIIIVSHFRCDWGNCPEDYITVEDMLPTKDEVNRNRKLNKNSRKTSDLKSHPTKNRGGDDGEYDDEYDDDDDDDDDVEDEEQEEFDDDTYEEPMHDQNVAEMSGSTEDNDDDEEKDTDYPTVSPTNSPTLSPTVTPYVQQGSIYINNEQVTRIHKIRDGYNVFLLENSEGPLWDYNPVDKLNFRVNMYVPGKHLYITSFIVNFQ